MEKITVQTTVHTTILNAWNYYTRPEHIMRWNFAADNWHCPHVINDVKVGGEFIARMETKDNSEGFMFGGTYTDVLFGKRLEYVMSDNRHVFVEFKNKGQNTIEIRVTFDRDSDNPPEIQKEGWQNILDNYKEYVESN